MKSVYLFSVVIFTLLIFPACTNIYESHEINITEDSVVYQETFSSSLGDFKTVSVVGTESWKDTLQYALMSGYVNSANKANETWLISPEIDLSDEDTARLSFDHVCRYFTNPLSEATLWVSENYQTDSLPASATWNQLITQPFTDPGSWTFSNSGQISLNEYAGKKIRIAFKYISTTSKAGTWEVKNFLVENRQAVVVKLNYGEGSDTIPYNIAGAIKNQSGYGYVKGYIVGYIWAGTGNNFVFGSDTCTQATNVLLADTNMAYVSKCLPVQLPAGVVRTALNLKDKKANLGTKVMLYGSFEAYFGAPGLKNTSYYVLENGETGGVKPVKTILSETFLSNSKGNFTIQHPNLPAGMTSVWNTSASYGVIGSGRKTASSSTSTFSASEGWLISPAFSLKGVSKGVISFDQSLNFLSTGKAQDYIAVMVSLDYNTGLPETASWNQLTMPKYPSGNSWTYVNTGDISLSDYSNEPYVRIALRYKSTATIAPTWEVKNLIIK